MFCIYCYLYEPNGVSQLNDRSINERNNQNNNPNHTNQLIQQSLNNNEQSTINNVQQQSNIITESASRSTLSLLQETDDKFDKTNETISPVRRGLVRTLRNNLHLKCLILTLLTGTCFMAIFWCSFATFTKVMINLHSFALRKKNAACDPAYLYIPSVFVVAFYLLYLIECFHSETRFSLKHMDPSIQIINELERLKDALPVIWWKALNYHYLRRTRLITRYRNGEAYSTTQVYFQRINSRITSTCYVYDLNDGSEYGNTVIDISKKVINLDKFPLTKIRISKGFAFANVQAANSFERQRNMFFSSSEQLDDFLEMREGMDLISTRFRDSMLCVSARKPWYVSQTAFWLFSILLLSWPYRILLNMNTGVLNYQIIKLFGNSNITETGNNADSTTLNEERSNLTSNDDLLGNLPPSYSQAMLWPPTYNYIKQFFYEQADTNDSTNALDRINKCPQTNQQQQNSSINEQINNGKMISLADNNQANQTKARIPSSLSCSFLNGQIVYLVNTLKNTTTLNMSISNNLNCGTSLDVRETTDHCSPLLNKNSRVQIVGAGSLVETENNLALHIDNSNDAFIIDEQDQDHKLETNSSNQFRIVRSITTENLPNALKRFSIRILRRIKSMQNLKAEATVNV